MVYILCLAEDKIKEMVGPSSKEQWLYWQYRTDEQKKRGAAMKELEKLLTSDTVIYFLCILPRIVSTVTGGW